MLKKLLIAPIRFYRFFLSPWIGRQCRFTPSCSSYAIEAIETHGALKGLWMAIRRIGRCNPWSHGGLDPVPPRHGHGHCPCHAPDPSQDAVSHSSGAVPDAAPARNEPASSAQSPP